MHQTHVEINIVFNNKKRKVKQQKQNKDTHTQTIPKKNKDQQFKQVVIHMFMYIDFTQAGIGGAAIAIVCYACYFSDMYYCCLSLRFFFFLLLLVSLFLFTSLTYAHYLLYVCLLVIREQNFILLLPTNEMGADFKLQFPHRLQYSTKFQCEINNYNRKKLFVYTAKCKKERKKNSSINFQYIERCWQTVDRLLCTKVRDQTLHFISVSFFIRLLLPKYLQKYNYHLDTSTISLCICTYYKENSVFNTKIQARQFSVEFFFYLLSN